MPAPSSELPQRLGELACAELAGDDNEGGRGSGLSRERDRSGGGSCGASCRRGRGGSTGLTRTTLPDAVRGSITTISSRTSGRIRVTVRVRSRIYVFSTTTGVCATGASTNAASTTSDLSAGCSAAHPPSNTASNPAAADFDPILMAVSFYVNDAAPPPLNDSQTPRSRDRVCVAELRGSTGDFPPWLGLGSPGNDPETGVHDTLGDTLPSPGTPGEGREGGGGDIQNLTSRHSEVSRRCPCEHRLGNETPSLPSPGVPGEGIRSGRQNCHAPLRPGRTAKKLDLAVREIEDECASVGRHIFSSRTGQHGRFNGIGGSDRVRGSR